MEFPKILWAPQKELQTKGRESDLFGLFASAKHGLQAAGSF